MMKFILATTNKNKLSEINDISKDYGINFELPQIPFEVDEDGETLYENALKKAQALVGLQRQEQGNILKKAEFYPYPPLYGSTSFHLQEELLVGQSRANASEPNGSKLKKQNNFCILSDDTGLFVESLNNAPGIHSARYDTTPDKRIQKLLKALEGKNNRNAKFVCTMVLLSSNGNILYTNTGEIDGIITNTTKGLNGFGYDPIFFIESLSKTMAQLTKEEKNTISHRAKALIPILEFIKTQLL